MAVAEGLAALKSLKSIYDIAKEVRESHDPDRLRAAAAQMFDLALAAREQTAALQEERNAAITELASLKAEINHSKNFDANADQYLRLPSGTGAFIYREKPATGSEAKGPYFCPNCFVKKQLSMLQPKPSQNSNHVYLDYQCPECSLQTRLQNVLE